MAPYRYPQVPRSSQTQLQVQPETQAHDNRFSWVNTPAEAEGHMWKRQSEVPPLPQLPDHLGPQPQPQPEPVQERGQSYYTSQSALGPQGPTERGQSYYTSQSARGLQPPQEPVPAPYIPDEKPKLNMEIPQPYSAAATVDANEQYASPKSQRFDELGPDMHPLSPTTPTKLNRTPTTNLPILTPSDVSSFPLTSYAAQPQPTRGGIWQHGFCSCSLPSICLPSLFCPCVTYGKTQHRLALRSDKKDPTNMLGYHPLNGSCFAFGILCGINGILAAIQHTRIRKAYEMDGTAGNVVGDCVKGLCCCCCMVAQDEKEVKWREEECRRMGHDGGRKEGYIRPSGMVFQQSPR